MGHINNFHLEIIRGLRQRGNRVLTMACGVGADFNVPFEKRFISLKNLKSTCNIRKILKAERFDIIILNTNLAAFLVRLALPKKLKKTTKVVNFVHGYLFSPESAVLHRAAFLLCEMLLRKKCDLVITMNSEDFGSAVKYRLGTRVVASRGVGITERRSSVPSHLMRSRLFGDASYVIAFVGELTKRKNQRFLIRCLPRIMEKLSSVRLCLVGDGVERERLEALASRLSVSDAVIFTGYRSDAMDFINACDLYVSSALTEGMPLNVIEAMSLGKTVLLSRIKGHSDLVSDGENGYLYDPRDEAEFSKKACHILLGAKLDSDRVIGSVKEYNRESSVECILKILTEEISDF